MIFQNILNKFKFQSFVGKKLLAILDVKFWSFYKHYYLFVSWLSGLNNIPLVQDIIGSILSN